MTLRVLAEKGYLKTAIANVLGVCEGTVRYHLKRAAEGAEDGRKNKAQRAEEVAGVIKNWFEAKRDQKRPVNVLELYEHLVEEHRYEGSYRSVLRYVRSHYPKPRRRTYRRVETPPGAQSQTDWAEYPRVDVGDGPEPLSAFIMNLSHSRKTAVIWKRSKNQLSWLDSHNGAYRRLNGVAATNRIDNVKTAVIRGAGAWGELNPVYRAYSRAVGFHIDACAPRQANAKGKAEAKVRLSRLRINPEGRQFDGVEHLQSWSDRRLERWAERAICAATGKTVEASWEDELKHLPALPLLPEPFDVAVNRPVNKDCTVNFESHAYTVPFRYVGQVVEVRGCADKVQVLAEGKVQVEYPRHTPQRILIDQSCYQGESTEGLLPPLPLGRMGRRLQEIMDTPVESRPLDLYSELAEVAR